MASVRQRGSKHDLPQSAHVIRDYATLKVYRWYFAVPPGSPKWITSERIEDTLRVWQPRYKQLLTAEDGLEILINVRNLLDVLYPFK
ncbi:MAG: hypothetical protein AB7O62_20430 [Pirellulales bacterium]